ncbi:ABC transporter substrate-binding protein [Halodesulfovibrio marinisediminis]|uniref:ABC-type Fe3+ transport system, substrate-binding protein n=1 Tax=Halodesulfovibrio marinisediminis DSM 17456 TaxID=1121457 RepID=A0A1N6I7S2_9BACT|nr:extracellular solute-binding protein [Halodesulfovibrio marinisediminis]SIO28067.1 ABC-type Fe3+ transport system, substrate-binding protein [Halodesulfovibrio marinisediminis DSM 17456]
MYVGFVRAVRYFCWCVFGVTVALLLCGGSVSAANASQHSRLQIITSYPPNFYEPFVKRFQDLHPEIAVSILNKKTTSAVAELLRGNARNFDVFWASSPDAFEILKQGQMLRRTERDRQYKAVDVNGASVDDPDGYFYGFALSAVGWMWNQSYLDNEEIAAPKCWEDIVDSKYYSHVVMTSPSRSGTTHLIVESILQKMGWEKGWAYLLRISGNLVTLSARSFSVTEGVRGGLYGVGLVIDILGRAPDADNLRFRYGEPALIAPAGIGALENGSNSAEAELFIDFMLSPEGQAILLNPQIHRLPVALQVYDSGKPTHSQLLKMIKEGNSKRYDVYLSQLRYNLVNHLFEEFITYKLLERRQLWKRMLSLERQHGADDLAFAMVKKEFYRLLSEVPVTEEQSRNPVYNTIFSNSFNGTPKSSDQQQQILQWQQFIEERFTKANELLDTAQRK